MFALIKTRLSKMNHSAKNSVSGISQFMGCNDSMMSSMPMIMR